MCRENRERRIGIDRVKDTVEKRLQEENETILHYQQLMRELVNQAIIILIMCCLSLIQGHSVRIFSVRGL